MALPFIPQFRFTGRQRLYTYLTQEQLDGPDAAELLREDLIQWVIPFHFFNAMEEQYLFDYYAGYHPKIHDRVKENRTDINNKIVMNYAKSFSRDIVSYFLSKPIQYVQRDSKFREDAESLQYAFDSESKNLVDYNIAMNMSVCGLGYRGIFTEKDAHNGTHLSIVSLDPRESFVVWSPNRAIGQLYCGTYYSTPPHPVTQESKTIYTIYTRNKKYVFESPGLVGAMTYTDMQLIEESDASLGGNFPIIEYQNSVNAMGDWESELSIMDSLDKLTSDSMNDIEQFVNSILLAQGFDLTPETLETLEQEKMLNIPDVPPGVQVVVKYIAEQVDNENVESLRDWLEATMRTIVGVPDRKQRGGGGADTGDAVFLRDGWQDIDLVAGSKEQFFIDADRKALATCIYIMQTFNEIGKEVKPEDIEIKFSRTKQANLQAKAQAYSTMVGASAPIAPEDALEFADLTNNVSDVIMRGEEYAQKKLKETAEAQQLFMNNKPPTEQTTQQSSAKPAQNNPKPTGGAAKGATN